MSLKFGPASEPNPCQTPPHARRQVRVRLKRGQLETFQGFFLSGSRGQNLALTVLYVPHSLDSGPKRTLQSNTSSCATAGLLPESGPLRRVGHLWRDKLSSHSLCPSMAHVRQSRPGSGLGLQVGPESAPGCLVCAGFARQRTLTPNFFFITLKPRVE